MRCERALELLSDYCEGALSPAMLVSMENHLAGCESCRAEAEGLRQVWAMLDSAPLVEPPAHLRASVWARIDAQEQPQTAAAPATRPVRRFDWRTLLTPRAAGWAFALLLIVVLAPIVVKGPHIVAGWFPRLWSRSSSVPVTLAGLPTEAFDKNRHLLLVPLVQRTGQPITVQITVTSGNATVPAESAKVDLASGKVTTVPVIPNTSDTPAEAIHLGVTVDGQPDSTTEVSLGNPPAR